MPEISNIIVSLTKLLKIHYKILKCLKKDTRILLIILTNLLKFT